jgi:two-component system sensor histidine kinase DegS
MFVNDWTVNHIGYSRYELIEKPMLTVIAPEEHERLLQMNNRRLAGLEVPDRCETVFLSKEGRRIPIELMLWTTDYRGAPAVAGIARDITESKIQRTACVKAQEEERKHLARALHDDITQELLLLTHRLKDIAGCNYGTIPRDAQERLADLVALVERARNKVRRFVDDLRPHILDQMGLIPALRWLTHRLTTEYNVHAEVRMLGEEGRLPSDAELALFRIAQEALNNIRKHACASEAMVTLEFGEGEVAMSISDNGRGFELPTLLSHFGEQHRFGLMGIVEWVHMLDGEYKIDTAPGEGTIVRVKTSVQSNSSSRKESSRQVAS